MWGAIPFKYFGNIFMKYIGGNHATFSKDISKFFLKVCLNKYVFMHGTHKKGNVVTTCI